MAIENQNVTELLKKWSGGDAAALEELTPLIYAELHRIAKRYISRERDGHTLQTTALVNEAYVRLINWETAKWENRAHFFGVSDDKCLYIFHNNSPFLTAVFAASFTNAFEL